MISIEKFVINDHEFCLKNKKFVTRKLSYDRVSYDNGLRVPVERWDSNLYLEFEDEFGNNVCYFSFDNYDLELLCDKTFIDILSEMTTKYADKFIGRDTLFDISRIDKDFVLAIYPKLMQEKREYETFERFYNRFYDEDYDKYEKDSEEVTFSVESFEQYENN